MRGPFTTCLPDKRAYRYPISVGREGFNWTGTETISRKQAWPDWYPPAEMRERDANLPEKMTGGLKNPLGAMALYLGNTLYRIHGTNDVKSIGQAQSSGCFRMLNAAVLHLASMAEVGTTVSVVASTARAPGDRAGARGARRQRRSNAGRFGPGNAAADRPGRRPIRCPTTAACAITPCKGADPPPASAGAKPLPTCGSVGRDHGCKIAAAKPSRTRRAVAAPAALRPVAGGPNGGGNDELATGQASPPRRSLPNPRDAACRP